ncbi:MAG: two-component system response regulator CreB [Verrucomicrobiales bacterium]|nr:two-component system response regulator CreB [Verrucomicrobiales bacterium]
MSARVLVVEDEPSIAETLLYALRTEGFVAEGCGTAGAALEAVRGGEPVDCLILDVGLPDRSGFDLCREIRSFSALPILFLTARDGEIDRVVGLEIGADDYVAKPFSPREVVARVRAILRRVRVVGRGDEGEGKKGPEGRCGLVHDERRRTVSFQGQELELSRNEYHLLLALMKHPGRVLTREQLMEMAWPDPGAASDRTVDAHVKLLRAKLRAVAPEADPIETRRGLGYALREGA